VKHETGSAEGKSEDGWPSRLISETVERVRKII
jgi:hypothetical protein